MSMLVLACSAAYGQSDKEFTTHPFPKEPETVQQPVRKHGMFSRRGAKAVKFKKQNVKHSAQYEYYERIEKAAHDRKKLVKQLSKPQYSNFLYYGHKHKPKRRPPNKMRYCMECGIRH